MNPGRPVGIGTQVDYAQQATVDPISFMTYSDVPQEWQNFQEAEIETDGSVHIKFSNGRCLTVPRLAIRPIDQSQLGEMWNVSIFGPHLESSHHPRPPAPVGLTAEEFRELTEVLKTARSPEEFLQKVQRMSITVRKTLEKTFTFNLGESHRAETVSRVAGLGISSMLQLLMQMKAEGSIFLEASPNIRLRKVQRPATEQPHQRGVSRRGRRLHIPHHQHIPRLRQGILQCLHTRLVLEGGAHQLAARHQVLPGAEVEAQMEQGAARYRAEDIGRTGNRLPWGWGRRRHLLSTP